MVTRLTTRHQIAGVVDLQLHPSAPTAKETSFVFLYFLGRQKRSVFQNHMHVDMKIEPAQWFPIKLVSAWASSKSLVR